MRKVCEVYLVSSASSDERGVELTFPVSQYEMMDAFEQIHTKSPGDVYWQVDEFYCFDYLAPHLDESMSIFEFNSLTEQLSKLDDYQETALEGLLQMQVKNHMQENSGIITVFWLILFQLRLIFSAHALRRIRDAPARDGGNAELAAQLVDGLVKFPSAIFLIILEHGELHRLVVGNVAQRHAEQPQRRIAVPQL